MKTSNFWYSIQLSEEIKASPLFADLAYYIAQKCNKRRWRISQTNQQIDISHWHQVLILNAIIVIESCSIEQIVTLAIHVNAFLCSILLPLFSCGPALGTGSLSSPLSSSSLRCRTSSKPAFRQHCRSGFPFSDERPPFFDVC